MVTYGDLMGLLLTFFVLLLSFSVISENDFNAAANSLQHAFGVLPGNISLIPMDHLPQRVSPRNERIARIMRERLQVMGRDEDIKVEYDKQGGLKISLPSEILFESASADMAPAAYEVLGLVAQVLSGVPEAYIEVRGHTDSRPLTTASRYRDNYDLSFARADTVARHVQTVGAIPLERFEIIACGAGQPVASNAVPEGRQQNRRVEVYVRGEFTEEELRDMRGQLGPTAEPPAPAPEPGGTTLSEVL
jgi:chemotaxis protein MotB